MPEFVAIVSIKDARDETDRKQLAGAVADALRDYFPAWFDINVDVREMSKIAGQSS